MAKKKNYYFTMEHEKAIVEYSNTEDLERRAELYIEYLEPAFDELINNIIFTFKFQDLPNIVELKEECKIWLTTITHKFDPDRGSKAFAFFTVTVKNWFIAKIKSRNKKLRIETSFEDMQDILEKELITDTSYVKSREEYEFVKLLLEEVDSWDKGYRGFILGDNDLKVVHALQDLFFNADKLEIFNKKAIYLHIRELTGLNTKQITRSIKKLIPRYEKFKKNWVKGNL